MNGSISLALALLGLVACGGAATHPPDAGMGGTGDRDAASPPPADMASWPPSDCSDCPSGYTCSSANGLPICRAPSGIPLFSHLFVFLLENTSWSTLHDDAATNTPYLHGLLQTAAYGTDYHGVTHPSLPNYLALTSGSVGVQAAGAPVACDCGPKGTTCKGCTLLSGQVFPCDCEQKAQHLGDQLDAAGKGWRDYGQSMGAPCNLTDNGPYAARHIPFLYYENVQGDAARCQAHVVDYGALAGDLAAAPALAFIAPDLAHDMHGTGLIPNHTAEMAGGDQWLAANLPALLASDAYRHGGAVFIVWDEDDNSGIPNADASIPFFVLSPLAKSGGFSSATHADHYALLATIEDGLGLPRLGGAVEATPLIDFFPAQ